MNPLLYFIRWVTGMRRSWPRGEHPAFFRR